MNLNAYMEQGIISIAGTLSLFYLSNEEGINYLSSFVPALEKSTATRNEYEENGHHNPPFLIASISARCNLHCTGCYARAEGMCGNIHSDELSRDDWKKVFNEASDLGVSFILLAGGEPLLRRDVIELASEFENILFPIFTNGTMLDEDYLRLFKTKRNLIPVFSIEGSTEQTDIRRGKGVSKSIENAMIELKYSGILFAASVTVTNENLHKVISNEFLKALREKGCGAVFYVEYVPAEQGTESLTLSDSESEWLRSQIDVFKNTFKDMSVFAFPGDEKFMGGCLSAGRGFFHINPSGGAEACPFSPHSQWNVKDHSILEILESDFFKKIQQISKLGIEQHVGGCTLFNYDEDVRSLLCSR